MLVFSMLRILEKFNLNALKNKLKEDMSNIGKMYNWQTVGILNI